MKKNLAIKFFCGMLLPTFCYATSFQLTSNEVNTINTNKTAVENRNYFDTELLTYYKGQADGSLSTSINRNGVMKPTSELESTDSSSLASKLLSYWDTLTSRYFFGTEQGNLEPLITQNLFSSNTNFTGTEVLDYSGLRDQENNGEVQPGRAYEFNGSQYVTSGIVDLNITDEMTVMSWIYLPSTVNVGAWENTILGAWDTGNSAGTNGWLLSQTAHGLLNTDTPYFMIEQGLIETRIYASEVIPRDTWVHITGKKEGDSLKIYINGSEAGSTTCIAGNINSPSTVSLKMHTFGISPVYFSSGKTTDTRIYNKALSKKEINAAMNGQMVQFSALQALYKMDEGIGTTTYDSSGKGHHGTVTGLITTDFHSSTTQGGDWQNQFGYTEDEDGSLSGTAGLLIPRDESNHSQDILGNPLEFKHRVNYNAQLVESHCGNFAGNDGYINIPDNDNLSFGDATTDSPLSISLWMKSDYSTGALVAKATTPKAGEFYILAYLGRIYFRLIDNNQSSTIGIWANLHPKDKWSFITVTYDGSQANNGMHIYYDGVQQPTSATDYGSGNYLAMENTTTPLKIGRRDSNQYYYDGSIADVKIFKKELTNTEIYTLRRGENIEAELIAHYPFSEGAGTTIYDASGNGNHGTATNDITESTFWSETQDVYHYNLREGFSLSANTKIPAQINTTINAIGNVLTNPASSLLNGAETKIKQYPAIELIKKDTSNVYFDTYGNPLSLGNDNLSNNMSGDNKITSQSNNSGQRHSLRWISR